MSGQTGFESSGHALARVRGVGRPGMCSIKIRKAYWWGYQDVKELREFLKEIQKQLKEAENA